jgi:hypothetical protein
MTRALPCAVELHDLTKSFGDVLAVDELSAVALPGEVTALFGCAARKYDSGFDLGLLGPQAACSYSLIRLLRTGFRRICHVPGSAAVTLGAGPGSGTRWPMP